MSNMHAHLDAERKSDLAQDHAEHPRRAHPVQTADQVLHALSATKNADLAQAMREGIVANFARHYQVPQGWKLAPCEPTREMLNAMYEAAFAASGERVSLRARVAMYAAMLAATTKLVTAQAQRPDDAAVDLFADAMKAKLAAVRANEHGGQYDPEQYCVDHLARLLVERQPLTDSAWLKRWTKDFCERLKPGPRRNEVLGIIRFCERHHSIMGGKEGGAA